MTKLTMLACRLQGVGGGSEIWQYHVRQDVKTLIEDYAETGDSAIEQQLAEHTDTAMGRFHQRKSEFVSTNISFEYNLTRTTVCITFERMRVHFDKAMNRPIALIHRHLKTLADTYMGVVPVKIVVAGGTSRHPVLQDKIRSMCKGLDLPEDSLSFAGSVDWCIHRE
jgi:hypothetical protein